MEKWKNYLPSLPSTPLFPALKKKKKAASPAHCVCLGIRNLFPISKGICSIAGAPQTVQTNPTFPSLRVKEMIIG